MIDTMQLEELWGNTLRSPMPALKQFECLAAGLVELSAESDLQTRQQIEHRLQQMGIPNDGRSLDLDIARLLVADEIGCDSWDELVHSITQADDGRPPLLFRYAIAAMQRGDFSKLGSRVGGPNQFDEQIRRWFEAGHFDDERETLAEIFSAACMLGHAPSVRYLLDNGADPMAGTRTGLSGFHYAVSSGRLACVRLLIERKVPMETRNMYGGTVLEQALWSAINEYRPDHVEIIEALLDAGTRVAPGTLDRWLSHEISSASTKERVATALRRH